MFCVSCAYSTVFFCLPCVYDILFRYHALTCLTNIQTVSKLVKPGFSVLIEKGAGSTSYFSDAEYEAAGAKIVEKDDVWKGSDIVMKVRGRRFIFV